MLKSSPNPVDVLDLQFKLRCRLKVFDNEKNETFSKNCNLISAASRYGLIFVGSSTANLQVLQITSIEKFTLKDGDKSDYPRRNIPLPSPPKHVSANCDGTILAVIVEKDNCPIVLFYDVKSFLSQNTSLLKEIRLSSTPGVTVLEINWNPAIPGIFTACKSDGSLGSYELKGTVVDCNEIPATAGTTTFCWSPKGKQISVGSQDGKITQYKPDLKAVKVINPPPLPEPHSLISLQWVSNYQFVGVYQSKNPNSQSCVIVVDAPKAGEVIYTNYDDVCYSNGSTRPPQFYMVFEQHWTVIMVASSNSMEVGVLGNSASGWTQWIMGDAARAELPLSRNHQDTLPIGFALDTGATEPVVWGETSLPPLPILMVLSDHGVLCCFNVVNLKPDAPSICNPPEQLSDFSGLSLFVTSDGGMAGGDSTPKPSEVLQPATKTEVTSAPTSNIFSQRPTAAVPTQESATPSIFGSLTVSTTSTSQIQTPSLFSNTMFGSKTVLPTPQTTSSIFANPQVPPSLPTSSNSFGFGEKTQQNTPTPALPLFGVKPQLVDTLNLQTPQNSQNQTSSIFGSLSTQPAFSFVDPPKPDAAKIPPTEVLKIPSVPSSKLPLEDKSETIEIKDDDINSSIGGEILDNEEMEELLGNLVKEECLALETEFKVLMHRSRKIKIDVGTDDEKKMLIKNCEEINEFIKEVANNCISQQADVHLLKQNLIQTWAWYEEARSRYNIANDPTINILLKAQPLDSAAEKQLHQIRQLLYYLDSQLTQANAALDEQWESFQDYCKKTFKIQLPTMEAIFQSMVKHNVIMQKLSYNLKDISTRIKVKRRASSISNPLIPVDNLKKLEDHMSQLQLDPENLCQLHFDRILNRIKSLSKSKTDKLRTFLKHKDVAPISTIKPVSILQVTPKSHKKCKSILGAAVSPILKPKETVSKNLFLQSTPKPKTVAEISANTAPNSLTFTVVKSDANLKSEAPQSTGIGLFAPKTPSLTFATNTIPSSSISAFAPTTQSVMFPSVVTTASIITTSQNTMFASVSTTAATFSNITSKSIATTATPVTQNFSFGNQSKPVQSITTMPSKFPSTTVIVPNVPKTTTLSTPSLQLFSTTASALKTTTTASSVISTFSFTNQGSIFGGLPQVNVTSTSSNSNIVPPIVTKPLSFSSTAITTTLTTSSSTKAFDITSLSSEISITPISKSKTAVSTPSTTQTMILSSLLTSTSATEKPVVVVGGINTTSAPNTLFSAATTTTTASSLFGNVSTTASVKPLSFGTAVDSPAFGAPKTVTTSADSSTKLLAPQPLNLSSNTPGTPVNAPSTQSSIFGSTSTAAKSAFNFGTVATSTTSLFGNTQSITTKPAVFAVPPSTIISTTAAPNVSTTPTIPSITTNQSIFATPSLSVSSNTITVTTSSVFGGTPALTSSSTTTTTTTQPVLGTTPSTTTSIFAAPSSSATLTFGSTTANTMASETKSIFGAALAVSTQAPFGTTSTAATSTTKSIFGTSTATTTSIQPSVFGNTSLDAKPTFGSTAPSTGSIFGATNTQSTVFGAATSVTTTQTSGFGVFGSTAAPTSDSQSVFGNSPASSQTQSIFGTATTSSSQPQSIFGAATTSPSVFGSSFGSGFGNTTPSTSESSPFGQATTSVFGGAPATTSTNVFGQNNTFGTTSSNIFGTPASTSSFVSSSPFGVSTPGSLFSKPVATTTSIFGSSGSVFGTSQPENTSPFGVAATSSNVFGGTAASTPSSSFSFAQAANNTTGAASFGFGGLNVGSTATSATSGFGSGFSESAPTAQQNPFGRSVFGSAATTSSSSIFGNPTNTPTSSIFGTGSPTNSFGSNSFGSSSGFGSTPAFGQSQTFQQSTFGSPQPGPFSGGAGSVAQSGFGSPPSFQKPSGFGSSPVFGNQPRFGGAPAFGNTASFGNTANKVFGTSPNTPSTFDSGNQQQGSTFANLASQNTIGFGNLAQQAQNQQSAPSGFTGNSSFSSWR